ncbi:hypothetical protein RBA41_23945 [Massilia sp. CCM 9210]|uniref:hypothetical protein n=1 Tax=Massilia scottii TaxID=3057166 RepID=UPI002796457B|nr:hypothetical protein [Massilia sp. CCM 9210]MDQ1816354.1 hypothetical protein [Massilia sp. CCM 9210]
MDKSEISKVVQLSKRPGKLAPASMSLSGPAGKRVVVSAAKRVIKTHSDVIKALAKR